MIDFIWILLVIILSPVILIAGLFILFLAISIILGIIGLIFFIFISLVEWITDRI